MSDKTTIMEIRAAPPPTTSRVIFLSVLGDPAAEYTICWPWPRFAFSRPANNPGRFPGAVDMGKTFGFPEMVETEQRDWEPPACKPGFGSVIVSGE